MTIPTACPPYGICVPVRYAGLRDGDTIEVHVRNSTYLWAIRLMDCWCPELHTGSDVMKKLGRAAMTYARQTLGATDAGDLRWWIPFPSIAPDKTINLADIFTFDRVPGVLYVGPSQTLNRMLVSAGLASTTKGGELGR